MKDLGSIAVAHGLTEAVVQTWHPELLRVPRVLVPVQLDALVVRDRGGTWAQTAMRAPTPEERGRELDAAGLLPEPFSERESPREPGVYLHWALPDALTRGAAGDSDVRFPAIPDRWLVVRLGGARRNGRRPVRGWVLAAGGAEPVVHDLDGFREAEDAGDAVEQPLTALGHGDPAWAAYFDNVAGRLGFHDPLEGVKSGPLAYLVCGWFRDPRQDPLARPDIRTPTDVRRSLDDLGWQMAGGSISAAVRKAGALVGAAKAIGLDVRDVRDSGKGPRTGPQQSLYHGAAVGLGWPAPGLRDLGGEAGGPPAPDAVKVVLGATLSDALGGLMAHVNGDPEQNRLLEAFQLGHLRELEEPDGRARVDALLHQSAFGSLPGGEASERIWRSPPPDAGEKGFPAKAGARRGLPGKKRIAQLRAGHGKVEARKLEQARRGDLRDLLSELAEAPAPEPLKGRWEEVRRSLPRFFTPADPVVLLQGAKRTFKHGGDGRFSPDGRLACRVSGACVEELTTSAGSPGPERKVLRPETVLERGIDNGSVPPECDELLREVVLLDPGTAETGAQRLGDAELTEPLIVEQTAWWALRDPRKDPAAIVTGSGLSGVLPSPLAVTPPSRPWNPLHLEWEAEYLPSAEGVGDWDLGEVDYAPRAGAADAGEPVVLRGRSLLTAGAAEAVAAAARQTVESAARAGGSGSVPVGGSRARFASPAAGRLHERTQRLQGDALDDIASALAAMDVLAAPLEPLHRQLAEHVQAGTRAGFLRLRRLRMVDGFGQVLDLGGSGPQAPVAPEAIIRSDTMTAAGRPDVAPLPPRYTTPARLLLRWVDAAGSGREARNADDRDAAVSPVCGWVMPNHLDRALEFFAADGDNLGFVRYDVDGGIVWEQAPGTPSALGAAPGLAMPGTPIGGMAQALLDWGLADAGTPGRAEPALGALLRLIDTTLWSVDPFAHAGEEHLALLVGHPLVLLRARLRLELADPAAAGADPRPVPVRLGSLSHWQDGLLAWFSRGDFRTLHAPHPAAAALARELSPGAGFLGQATTTAGYYGDFATSGAARPVEHPYVDAGGEIRVRPDEDVDLLMIVEPHSIVHATSGLLPRKAIGMRREWIAGPLARLSPSFRFGPVLVDPKRIRMPIPSEIHGTWTWDYRADAAAWAQQPVVHTTGDALLSDDPAAGSEGWLRLTPPTPEGGS